MYIIIDVELFLLQGFNFAICFGFQMRLALC